MGAGASKVDGAGAAAPGSPEEQSFYAERPVRFSPSLVQHLSDLPSGAGGDNAPSASRQTTLDEHVRARIASELQRLKAQEAEVQTKIQQALEKENREKEGDSAEKAIKSSQVLQQELEDVTRRVEEHREKRDIKTAFPEALSAREGLLACYRQNQDTPLNCWNEVNVFRLAVKKAEQHFVETEALRA